MANPSTTQASLAPDFGDDLLGFGPESTCWRMVAEAVTTHPAYLHAKKGSPRKASDMVSAAAFIFESWVIFQILAPGQLRQIMRAPLPELLHDFHSKGAKEWLARWSNKFAKTDVHQGEFAKNYVCLTMLDQKCSDALEFDLARRQSALSAAAEARAIASELNASPAGGSGKRRSISL